MGYKKVLTFLLGIGLMFWGASPVAGAGRMAPDEEHTEEPAALESNAGTVETGIELGMIAPDISFTDLDGNMHNLSDYRDKAVMLNFGANWCSACRYEKPFMQEIYDAYKEQGFVILSVYVQVDKPTVEDYVVEHGYTFPAFMDLEETAFPKYNKIGGIPQTYLINREGKIINFIAGARNWASPENRSLITNLLED